MLKDKLLTTVTALLFAIGLGCILWVVTRNMSTMKQTNSMGNLDCVQKQMVKSIKDTYMAQMIPDGTSMRIFANYYNCNPVKREDLVWFRFSQHISPVVRIVKGIPGDEYHLKDIGGGRWSLYINGSPEQTLSGEHYFVESPSVPPLRTYELSRKGVLAEDEYIILSSTPPGMSDSGNLGLIRKTQFDGRVFPME